MKCQECREKLWDALEGTLSEEEEKNLKKHLEKCEECAQEAEWIKNISKTLKDLPEEELPVSFHEELMQKIAQENTSIVSAHEEKAEEKIIPFPRKKKQSWKNYGLVAAAVLVVVAVGGTQRLQMMRPSQEAVVQQMQEKSALQERQTELEDMVTENVQTPAQYDASQNHETEQSQMPKQKAGSSGSEQVSQNSTVSAEKQTISDVKEQAENSVPQMVGNGQNTVSSGVAAADTPMTFGIQGSENNFVRSADTAVAAEEAVAEENVKITEEVYLSVLEVEDALEDVKSIGKQMNLTEVEKTENSITYSMAEKQKPEFLGQLKEIGECSMDAEETVSEVMIQMKVICVQAEQ